MTPTKRTIERYISRELQKEGITPGALARLLRHTWERSTRLTVLGRAEDVLRAYDKAVGNFGVEGVGTNSHNAVLLYSNTGQSYSATLTWDLRLQKFRFDSWGGFVERNEKLFAE